MILLVDNYDSFTYNLAQYLGTFTEVEVLRNDDERLYEQAEVADASSFSPVQAGRQMLGKWKP